MEALKVENKAGEEEVAGMLQLSETPRCVATLGVVDFVTAEDILQERASDESAEGDSEDTYFKTVMYMSRGQPHFHLKDHIEDFRRFNKEHGITGFIVCMGSNLIFQFIQGDREPITQLWSNIKKDANHKIIKSSVTVAWQVMSVWDAMNVLDDYHFDATDSLEVVYSLFEGEFLSRQCNSSKNSWNETTNFPEVGPAVKREDFVQEAIEKKALSGNVQRRKVAKKPRIRIPRSKWLNLINSYNLAGDKEAWALQNGLRSAENAKKRISDWRANLRKSAAKKPPQ